MEDCLTQLNAGSESRAGRLCPLLWDVAGQAGTVWRADTLENSFLVAPSLPLPAVCPGRQGGSGGCANTLLVNIQMFGP